MSSGSDDEINNSSEYDDVSDYSEDYEIPITNNIVFKPDNKEYERAIPRLYNA